VNVPLAPEFGAVKVTESVRHRVAPRHPSPSLCRFYIPKTPWLIVAFCGVPAVAVMVAAGPTLFMREKLAGAATPPTVAVTA